MPINQTWLDQVAEPALDPDRPIIDPHHHLWDRDGSRYLLDELLADTGGGHTVVATVFVECGSMYRADGPEALRPVGETEFVNGIAAQSASGGYGAMRACAGIVGHANLLLGAAVDEVLEAHIAAARGRFRGIRHSASWDASDQIRNSHSGSHEGLYLDPTFREGFARLAHHGLTFDAWLYHPQIPQLVDLAHAHPEVTIIADHFGGPLGIGPYQGRRAEIYPRWKQDFSALAKCPNVVAKLGGINMAINGFEWHKRDKPPTSEQLTEATRDFYLHAIDCFGPNRCMFESNYPVDKVSCSYTVLWNSFKQIAEPFTDTEKSQMFHDTAARVYRLNGDRE